MFKVLQPTRTKIVQYRDLTAVFKQCIHKVATDETGTARYNYFTFNPFFSMLYK